MTSALAALNEWATFKNTLRRSAEFRAFGNADAVANERLVAKFIDQCPDLALALIRECDAEARPGFTPTEEE